ncbi:MAG TPA: isoprenylcysteine carboxylmethyltransferase family protein [Acidimicrobiales bacterium]|nr:isoprenylcysteine carboxylmethyltransferase family protein [Acidimicrobiales bacterium]
MGLHRSTSRVQLLAAYALVAAQLGLLAAMVLWEPEPDFELPGWADRLAWGAGVAGALWLVLGVVSLGRSATALPLPVVHGRLRTGGLYRLSRHPIYTGLLALAWSWSARSGAIELLALAGALNLLLVAKAVAEERLLEEAYPGYREYAGRTPRFLPLGFRVAGGRRPRQ